MNTPLSSSPFGTSTRTSVLLVLAHRERAHVRELARLTHAVLSVVQNALRSLERDGLVCSATEHRTRFVSLDPAYPAYLELRAYLRRLLQMEETFRQELLSHDD